MFSWCCVHKRGKQKAWFWHDFLMLRSQAGHDFLMLRSQAGKAKGMPEAWLLDVAFTSGESQRRDLGMTSWCCVHKRGKPKEWLRHDFLMLRSQAGKAKGVTEAWLLDVAFTSGESKRHDWGMTSWCCVHKRRKQKAWLRQTSWCCVHKRGKQKAWLRHDFAMTSWCCVHKRGKQKEWLRHDFLMLCSQAGKAKGTT